MLEMNVCDNDESLLKAGNDERLLVKLLEMNMWVNAKSLLVKLLEMNVWVNHKVCL